MAHKGYCGRCGLTFATRWAWAHHGCEQAGRVGAYSECLGQAVRDTAPGIAAEPHAGATELLRQLPDVRARAHFYWQARLVEGFTRPFVDAAAQVLQRFSAAVAETQAGIGRLLRNLDHDLHAYPVFNPVRYINVQPSTKSSTLADFVEAKKRLRPEPSQWHDVATVREGQQGTACDDGAIEHRTITVPAHQPYVAWDEVGELASASPLPFEEMARRLRAAVDGMRAQAFHGDAGDRLFADERPAERPAAPAPRHRPAPSPVPAPAMPRRFATCNPRRYVSKRARARQNRARRI